MPVVEDLANASSGVAVIFEPERQSGDVRLQFAKMGAVDIEAEGARTQAREHAGARGIADGLLAIRLRKGRAACCDGVQMGCEGRGAVAAELWAEVIRRDEEDIQRCGYGRA